MVDFGSIALDIGREEATNQGNEIPTIIEFVESSWGLDQKLFPVQKVILKAFYGLPLEKKEKTVPLRDWRGRSLGMVTEAEYLQRLHAEHRCNIGEIDPDKERKTLVLSIGRRSGKTFITACMAVYETYKLILRSDPHKYYGLPASNPIQLIAVATDKDQAGLLYSEASGMVAKCEIFKAFSANYTQSFAKFQTPADIERYGRWNERNKARCSLNMTFRSCIAKGLRGAGNIFVALDEVAHFLPTGQGSAETVYDAVTPSTAAFTEKDETGMPVKDKDGNPVDSDGRIIMISSPLGKQGFFYQHFEMGFEGGAAAEDMLCIQAPTWEVNPTVPSTYFQKQYAKNPTVFFTEFGAEFTDRTKGWIERESDLLVCIDKQLRPKYQAPARSPHFMGVDVALKGDGTAVAIGHINEQDQIVLDLVDWIKAGEGKYADQERLEFDEVADWIRDLSRRFYIVEGVFDQHAGIPMEQAVHNRGLKQFKYEKFTRDMSSQIYKNFMDMMWDGRLVLYDYPIPEGQEHCGYIQELLELQATQHSKYITLVEAPNVKGKHDDRSDALVRMVWLASQHLGKRSYIAKGAHHAHGGSAMADLMRQHRQRHARGGSHPDRQFRGRRKRR